MTSSLLRIGDHVRQPLVQPTPSLRSRDAVDRGSEQRVREANAVRLDEQDPRLLRLEEVVGGIFVGGEGRRDQLPRRPGERRRREACEPCALRQTTDPLARDAVEVPGHRKRAPSGERAPVRSERAGDLEGEERISSRRPGESRERRTRRRRAETVDDQVVQRPERERPRHDPLQSAFGQRALEPERDGVGGIASSREDEADA